MSIQLLPSGHYRLQVRRVDLTVDDVFPTRAAAEKALARYEGRRVGAKAARKAVLCGTESP